VVDAAARDRWVPGPEIPQVPTDLFASLRVRVGRAGTRIAATGLGQVRRMSAVSYGYQEREVQPLLEFSNGVAETAVPMRGACPARIAQYGRLALPACACNRVIYAAWAICGRPGM
jgi:hypothetical protein